MKKEHSLSYINRQLEKYKNAQLRADNDSSFLKENQRRCLYWYEKIDEKIEYYLNIKEELEKKKGV